MPQVIWAPSALKDVQRLHQFLAVQSPDAARRAVKRIRSGTKLLALHPEIGRAVEEMEPEYREWLISFGESGYVVMYRYIDAVKIIVERSRCAAEIDISRMKSEIELTLASRLARKNHVP